MEADLPHIVEGLEGAEKDSAAIYLRVMKKIAAKGDGYVASEIERLSKMVNGGSISPAKATKFALKLNVLSSFESE